MPLSWARLTSILFWACGGALAATQAQAGTVSHRLEYRVAINAALTRIDVEACRAQGAVWPRLYLASEDAGRVIVDLHANAGARELELEFRQPLQPPESAACVRYGVRLDLRVGREVFDYAKRYGRDLVTSPDTWMLAPQLNEDDQLQVEFVLPPGIAVSAPWQPLNDEFTRYVVRQTPVGSWAPMVVFGRFKTQIVGIGESRLRIVALDGDPQPNLSTLTRWMRSTAAQVKGVFGRFPEPDVQVVLTPILGDPDVEARRRWFGESGPMPDVGFARILRSGGAAAHFQFNQSASYEDLMSDWTATHEFSHLLLPYLSGDGSWVAEGFASYYQNILLARAGIYSQGRAWNSLHAGLMRGRGDGRYRDTLAESMSSRRSKNALMRRYWTGAAVALMADVELRRASGNRKNLDTVLGELAACCLPSRRAWTVEELFAKLDQFAGAPVFTPTIKRYYESTEYPDVGAVYARLGIEAIDRETVRLHDAPEAAIRLELVAPR